MLRWKRKSEDPFDARRRLQEVWQALDLIAGRTAPNATADTDDSRTHRRHNRALPALVVPLADDQPQAGQACYAITKDVSSEGMSFILVQPLASESLVCGVWVDGPYFFQANVRQNTFLGGGFWQAGVQLVRTLPRTKWPELLRLVEGLDPCTTVSPT